MAVDVVAVSDSEKPRSGQLMLSLWSWLSGCGFFLRDLAAVSLYCPCGHSSVDVISVSESPGGGQFVVPVVIHG